MTNGQRLLILKKVTQRATRIITAGKVSLLTLYQLFGPKPTKSRASRCVFYLASAQNTHSRGSKAQYNAIDREKPRYLQRERAKATKNCSVIFSTFFFSLSLSPLEDIYHLIWGIRRFSRHNNCMCAPLAAKPLAKNSQ